MQIKNANVICNKIKSTLSTCILASARQTGTFDVLFKQLNKKQQRLVKYIKWPLNNTK